ncbi:MAG: hypothetical protein J5929_05555 [Eubacterium sp.]|nr:hypothetical protein [Eubacterium sp.]
MDVSVIKGRKTRRSFATVLATLLIVTSVFGNVSKLGALGRVYAGGRVGDYGIVEVHGYESGRYPKCVFDDDYFDSNGNLTLELKAKENDDYTLLYQDETNKKVYLNKNYFLLTNEYLYIKSFIINGEKIIKYTGGSITLNKSDFKSNPSENYGKNYKDITIESVTSSYTDQWYRGFWLDSNGDWTYKPLGSWKGSGDYQWYEDTAGWYPTSQWMKADKFYKDFNAYKYKSDAAQSDSASWSSNFMEVDSAWFYFDSNGYAASNGWYNIDGYWYYFENFLYEAGCWRDGYYINSDGTQTYSYTGSWKSDANGWWYSDTAGWYPSNQSQIIDGKTYYFKPDGYLATDMWIAPGELGTYSEETWIHVNSSGIPDKYGYYDENGEWKENTVGE